MKYVLAKYLKNPLDINDAGKTIGVIVQSKDRAKLKFSNNTDALKQYDPEADLVAFESLEKSLKEILTKNNIIISTPNPGQDRTIAPTDTKFLEELRKSYQGKHQFSEIKEVINYPNLNNAVNELYTSFVNI